MNYANSSLGRVSIREQLGPPDLNAYGLWLVKDLTSDVEGPLQARSEPLHQYLEPIEELNLSPANTYSVVKQQGSLQVENAERPSAIVATTADLNERFYARYNLKGLPRGALVTAEVWMRALSWSGAPTPTIQIELKADSDLPSPTISLWKFTGGEVVGVWQPQSRARLELAEHIVRNAYNAGDNLYLAFSADFNTCEFAFPELIIRFVREENLLANRQLP